MSSCNKVLIFVTRYLCYASNESFADGVATQLSANGYDVEICNIIDDKTSDTLLTQYIGRKYVAVIDFNSVLPRAMVGEDRFLDLIDGPFINYIVDHPLYHHPILSIPLKNYYVICIDKLHKEYIEKNYPYIKDSFFLPLPGAKASSNVDFESKKDTILFSGTYYDPGKYENMINNVSDEDRRIILDMVDILKDVRETPEHAFETVVRDIDYASYPVKLNSLYLADIYSRALQRKRVIDCFVNANANVTILGNEWDKYDKCDRISVINGMDYLRSLNVIASCKMLLNVLPGFRMGSHDRIYTGMINRLAVITDTNEYLDEMLDDSHVIKYDANAIENEAFRICELILDKKYIEDIAYNAVEKARCSFSYANHAEGLIYILTQL